MQTALGCGSRMCLRSANRSEREEEAVVVNHCVMRNMQSLQLLMVRLARFVGPNPSINILIISNVGHDSPSKL